MSIPKIVGIGIAIPMPITKWALRYDRGGDFMSNEFTKFCIDYGIKRQVSTLFCNMVGKMS